jgi:hypothetical protein
MQQIPELLSSQNDSSYSPAKYSAFQRSYFDFPQRFARECITWPEDETLAPYQGELLDLIPQQEFVAAMGCHGLGKTTTMALAIHWFALTRNGRDWKCLTTASAWQQLEDYLWPEIHKWARAIRWDIVGREPYTSRELLTLELKLSTGKVSSTNPEKAERMEGGHADHLLYLFDESKIVPDSIWDSVMGAMSTVKKGKELLWLAVSTPGDPVGRFHDIMTDRVKYQHWYTREVSIHEVVAAGRVGPQWIAQCAQMWGETSALYINKALGKFASSGEESVIPSAWIEAAIQRGLANPQPFGRISHASIDPARKGGDPTVYAFCNGDHVFPLVEKGAQDTMETAGQIVINMRAHRDAQFVMDTIGVGAGPFDRVREVMLAEEGTFRIFEFIASGRTEWRDRSNTMRFADIRSASWWNLRELLDPAYEPTLALPDDPELRTELVAPSYKVLSGGVLKVEPKEDIRKRINRSTNRADAVIMLFWQDAYNFGITYA